MSSFLCALLLAAPWSPGARAASKARRPVAAAIPDVAANFAALAQQRPWRCPDQQAVGVPGTGWTGGLAQCAWQNRLRVRHWSGQGGAPPARCVSAQAHWWAWARNGGAPAASPAAWRAEWPGQSLVDDSGSEKRIVILRRQPDGAWSATEWRWNPSTRAATRVWQEGRWKQLAARAAQLRQAPGAAQARALHAVLEANLGARAGEVDGDAWRWKADGLCLTVDAGGLGPQQMQLPYSADDSRLEQRAAVQLQLARRFPKATWLSAFALVPTAPHVRGGAKFYAIWTEGAQLMGQLWMTAKGDGPPVRLRITLALPMAAAGQPDPQALALAHQLARRELMGLATSWANVHE